MVLLLKKEDPSADSFDSEESTLSIRIRNVKARFKCWIVMIQYSVIAELVLNPIPK